MSEKSFLSYLLFVLTSLFTMACQHKELNELPPIGSNITTEAGDIMLCTNNQLCIFFDSNSWQYTRIGKIEGMTKDQLKNTFGDGQVNITLSL